ncbi:MAG: ribonuclease P protein component [Thermodesulfobacteriota bacterium]
MYSNRVFTRLHKRKDILRVLKEGWRRKGPSFDIIARRGGEDGLRIAVVVPMFAMRAVDRNKVRRRAKEALRRGGFLGGIHGDVVVRARREAYGMRYSDIVEELRLSFAALKERDQRGK